MRGCRFFNSFCTVCVCCVARCACLFVHVRSIQRWPGFVGLRCAVLFVFLMLDTARLRCGFTGSVTPNYAAMRQALSRVPSPMDHPATVYELRSKS